MYTREEMKHILSGTYREGEDTCYMSNDFTVEVYGGVCAMSGMVKEEVGPSCPDTKFECPFNQSGPDATFRFEITRMLYELTQKQK